MGNLKKLCVVKPDADEVQSGNIRGEDQAGDELKLKITARVIVFKEEKQRCSKNTTGIFHYKFYCEE